jgi:hypothetical protein
MTWPLQKTIWRINYQARARLLDLVNSHRSAKQVIHITSPKELRLFRKFRGAQSGPQSAPSETTWNAPETGTVVPFEQPTTENPKEPELRLFVSRYCCHLAL